MAAPTHNPFVEFVRRYYNDPVAFVREVLGFEPDEWQVEFLTAIAAGKRGISVRSGHGVGKSSAASWAMLWYLLTRYPVKVVVTAPTSAQLFDALFAELKSNVRKLPPAILDLFEVKTDRIELKADPTGAFISARTARAEAPEALQGVHCFARGTVDVLTRRGWVALEDVTTADAVLCRAPHEVEARWAHPETVHSYHYEGELHVHESRFLRYAVTPGHKFEYERRQCNVDASGRATERWVPEVRPVAEIQKQLCRIRTTFTPLNSAPARPFVLPAHQPMRYGRELGEERPALTIAAVDWAEFLGWYTAEGWLGRSRNGAARSVSIAQSRAANPEKYARIAALVGRMGFKAGLSDNAVTISSTQLARAVEELCPGHSAEKRAPKFLFESNPEVIRAFLDAYRAGDGCGDHDYITSSPGLADDVQRLILLCGSYATINRGSRAGTVPQGFVRPSVRNHDIYRVREWHGRSVHTAQLRPEKRRVERYSGPVDCLTVPGGMFFVRDRATSKPFWTHNSENVMLVADEASGVAEAVFEAAVGSMSGENAVTLLLGNPTRSSGFFFDTHHKNRANWHTIHVSCLRSKMVSAAFVKQVADTYGEDSNAYRVRVLGEFPRADDDTVIALHLVDDATKRVVAVTEAQPMVWGVDVARFGDDATALAKRRGNTMPGPVRKWKKLDLMQTVGVIKAEWDECPPQDRPVEILVDSIGLGAGVVDRLRELNLPARGINVSESPALKGTYLNLRTELWFAARAWFERRECSIFPDEELVADLVSVKYLPPDSSGKLRVESKEQTKKRLRRSPDVADAFLMTFASDAGTAIYGSSVTGSWNRPLKRNLPVV